MDGIYITLIMLLVLLILFIIISVWYERTKQTMDPIPENTFPFQTFVINLDRKPERYQYTVDQLNKLGLTNYQRWKATDGFKAPDEEMLGIGIPQELINKGRGLAGCAASHMRLWKQIAENKSDWTLILEDDAHFHPKFMELFHQYWKQTPKYAKIIFPGWCAPSLTSVNPVVETSCMCLQGYMINSETAKFLLDNLPQMTEPIDIIITEYFRNRSGSFLFNGNVNMNGIRPDDYKEQNNNRCMFNGIIYQNHQEQGSTIHCVETVFEK